MTIIIGAGLAGLAAGYELTKAGQKVTILEAAGYPGGRVRSLPVANQMIDFGGFIVYPWYTAYHRMAKELGLHDAFEQIPPVPVYYEITRNTFTAGDDISIPLRDTARIYAAAAPKMILHRPQIDRPPIDAFGDETISSFLRKALKRDEPSIYETFADIVCQGYCYGPVDTYRMAVVAPIVLNTTFRGDLTDSVSFAGSNHIFADALATYIQSHGGSIHYNEPVISVSTDTTVTTDTDTYNADAIIYAAPYHTQVAASLIKTTHTTQYTTFYNIVVQFDAPPEPQDMSDWGAIFYLPNTDMPFQILSAVNIHHLTNQKVPAIYANFNVIVREPQHTELDKEALLEVLQPELRTLFPDEQAIDITQSVYWDGAMPVATSSTIQAIQQAQGVHNIWYAGDCLGSPSMETALRTGIHAAEQVLHHIST
jgi:protoporphyrinogen oxidase